MIRLQNRFLFYDGEKIKNGAEVISIDLTSTDFNNKRFFVNEKEIAQNGGKLHFNNNNPTTLFVTCKDKNGKFLWKTNTVMLNYEDEDNSIGLDVQEEIKKIQSMFDSDSLKRDLESVKNSLKELKTKEPISREEIDAIVENFNIFTKNTSDKISAVERSISSYKNTIDLYMNTFSNDMVKRLSETISVVENIKIPESPFDLDLGEHDVPAGYFVSFENGKVSKYKFGQKEPFGVALPDGKIRIKGACDVRNDGVDIKVGGIVMGDKNGIASKYSRGYQVVKILDSSHCTVVL